MTTPLRAAIIDALAHAGCEKVFSEKRSGRTAADCSALAEAIEFVRAGDTLVVTRLDRLARSTQDLHNIVADLDKKGVGFRCLAQAGVDTTSTTGKLTLAILGAEGIAKAKLQGKYRGRAPSIDYGQIKKLHSQGISPTQIASILKIGRTSVYRALSA